MKRFVYYLLVGVLALTMITSTFIPRGFAKEVGREVSVLYFNDAHEISPVINSFGNRGGVARLKTVIDNVRKENKHTVVAFGGDLGGGTLFGGVFKGFPIVEAFNQIPIDIANFGQHDFDFGSDVTQELVAQSNFQWISSNLTDKNGVPFANVPQYSIQNVQGIKIGFIGLTDGMMTTGQEGKVFQQDIIKSAQAAVKLLKDDRKVDIIIALTQQPRAQDIALLDAVPEIEAVFSEEMYEDQSTIYRHKGKLIMTPEGNIGSVIRLNIVKHKQDITMFPEVIRVNSSVPENPKLAELAAYYENKLSEELDKTIAYLNTDLVYGANHESRFQETNIGNFTADSFRSYFNADIGLMNGGGIRASVPKGDFTLRDANSILPFRNKVMLVELTGAAIRDALENSVSKISSLGGGFLQVSGISYSYNPNQPIGGRIVSVNVNGEPLNLDKKYTVAVTNYIYNGGDGYTMNKDGRVIVDSDNARTDVEVLIDYAKGLGVIDVGLEGRITIMK